VAQYLIDSHIFFWAVEVPAKLSLREKTVLVDSNIDVAVSVVSFWELSIKLAIGRLAIPGTRKSIPATHFSDSAAAIGFSVLPIAAPEAEYIRSLPKIHGDPFDRLLIAQASLSGRTLMTRDTIFSRYPGLQLFEPPSTITSGG
jgi:PIN domain nuclease of toxin-antitoxin system